MASSTNGSSFSDGDDFLEALVDSPEMDTRAQPPPALPPPRAKPLGLMTPGELHVFLDAKDRTELKNMVIEIVMQVNEVERRAVLAEAENVTLRNEIRRIVEKKVPPENVPPDIDALGLLDILDELVSKQLKEGRPLEYELYDRIAEKISTLYPNKDEIDQAVNEWMEEIRSNIELTKAEIREKQKKYNDALDKVISQKKIEMRKLQKENFELDKVQKELNAKEEIRKLMQQEIQTLDRSIGALEARESSRNLSSTPYYDARSTPGPMMTSTPEEYVPVLPKKKELELKLIPRHLLESPELFLLDSPYPGVASFNDTDSMSIHTTPRSAESPYSVTPPSPFDIPTPLMQSYGENETPAGALGTITMPGPLSKFAPRTGTVRPSTQSHVTNRFDIGKSFNLHTVCQTSTPYRQVTRVASSIPESGYSGEMINHPLSITHSAEITPPQYKTPFVSQSRFGYTDPTASVLNVPPGLVIPAHFQEQGSSPDVETYGTPPAVTPTTTRRHGLFTPKGIFRKKHYNIRRIYEPEYYQSPQLPWSPQYLPDEGRSPISSLTGSSRYSDKSCSPCGRHIINRTFRASPVMDRTFDTATSHAMNRTFDATIPGALDNTFDATSPKTPYGTYGETSSHAINRTFDASSPEALYETQDASSPYAINRTFDASPQSNLSGTFDAEPQYNLNRTFDASSPVPLNRTFEVSTSPAFDRTFAASPHTMNKTFQTSPASQSMNRTFDETLESLFHVPYRRPMTTSGTPKLTLHPTELFI